MPHGVLFRGTAEGRIRKKLKETEIDIKDVQKEIETLVRDKR